MIELAKRKSRFGLITILQDERKGSIVYLQAGFFQSEADRNGVSMVSYIHAIYDLLGQADSRKVLMIGCGGGTLATMLCKNGREVTVLDKDPQAFLLARKYFALPSGAICRVADGCEHLLSDPAVYDAIVLDAFVGDQIPAHLQSSAFFRLAQMHLSPRGCVLANVHVRDDLDNAPDRMASRLAAIWPDVRILDTEGSTNRNAIVIAGETVRVTKPVLRAAPQISADEVDAELRAMNFRPWREADAA